MSDAGHNGPDRETYLKHQAIAILDAEKAAELRDIRKRHRKDAELAGVPLGHMDWVINILKQPVGEIAGFFRDRLTLLSHNGVNLNAKLDVNKVLGDHTEDQTFAGQLAAMKGTPCSPPANLTPNEQQTWIRGWHEGKKARDAAKSQAGDEDEARAEKAAALAEATGADKPADETTAAAQELGGDGYGEDPVSVEPEKPPHQAKKTRVKKTPEPAVH